MAVNYGSLPFAEAIAFFRAKLNLPTQKWDDLLGAAHDRAFVVAGAMQADLLADLREAVDKAIAEGTTIETFRKDFKQTVAQRGWTGWTGQGTKAGEAWRTRVIYETNLFTSYSAGRTRQMKEVANLRPYWRYRHSPASVDPRKEHVAWDGLILKHDDPWWTAHTPPNGFGCKCYIETLAERDMKKQGLAVTDKAKIPFKDGGVDKGWDYQPGASADKELADIIKRKKAGWPQELADAFDDLIKNKLADTDVPSKPQFKLQATAKAAAKYIIDSGMVDFADYSGISPDIANECNKSLFDHISEFPELRKNQKFIGTIQAQHRRAYDLMVERVFSHLRAINPPSVTDELLRDLAKRHVKIQKTSSKAYAQSWANPDVSGVSVNREWGKHPEKLKNALQKDVLAKWHPEGTDSIKAVMDHEFGHQIDDLLGLNRDREIIGLWKSLSGKIKQEVSEYAGENISEFIAEAWAEYRNNPTPRPVASKVGAIVKSRYKSFSGNNRD